MYNVSIIIIVTTATGTELNDISQLDPNGYYTYEDYLTWTFAQRVELYQGKLYHLSPNPNRRHQTISGRMHGYMFYNFNQSSCDIFSAPFDVRLPVSLKSGSVDTVVQPDLCVICDKNKLDKQGCNGAPDLVVEILSPGNSRREMREKYSLYEAAGVREYWLIQPESETVLPYILNDEGTFIGLQPVTAQDKLTSHAFPELTLDLAEIFAYDE